MYCRVHGGSVKYAVWPNEYSESLERPQIAQDVARPKWESKNPQTYHPIPWSSPPPCIVDRSGYNWHGLTDGPLPPLSVNYKTTLSPQSLSDPSRSSPPSRHRGHHYTRRSRRPWIIVPKVLSHQVYLIQAGHHSMVTIIPNPTHYSLTMKLSDNFVPTNLNLFITFRMTIIPFIIVPDMS